MEIKNLYDNTVYNSILERISLIKQDSTPMWGSLSAAQALDHLAEVLSTYNGKPLKNNFIARLLKGYIRKMVLSDKPFERSIQTNPQFLENLNNNFQESKQRLLKELHTFKNLPLEEIRKIKHPLFGYLSPEDRGWAQYKHINHHLEQFGA